MTTTYWSGTGDWNLDAATHWSPGVPTAATPAVIEDGTSTISTSGQAASLQIDAQGTLNLVSGATATIGGELTLFGAVTVGAADIAAPATMTVATTDIRAGARIVLQGSATNEASLVLTGAAPTNLNGSIRISGDAALQFGSGAITSIGNSGTLELDGAAAQVLTDGGASSALLDLAGNHGRLYIEGNGPSGAASLTIGKFANSGTVHIDAVAGDGGSTVTFTGKLTNIANFIIGNTELSASTTVYAPTLAFVPASDVTVQGNAASGATEKASLVLAVAAQTTLTTFFDVFGDAEVQFASGKIMALGESLGGLGGGVSLWGSGAEMLTNGGASSALASLGAIGFEGSLSLQGDTSYGAGGATLTTTKNLKNDGTLVVDQLAGEGGSALTIGGTLTNDRTLHIGNASLSASTTVRAVTLVDSGELILQGNAASGATDEASLILSGGVPTSLASLAGSIRVSGDAALQFGKGKITSIAGGGALELDGAEARILTDSGAASALAALGANAGTLTLEGGGAFGAGGAALTTKAFANSGAFNLDAAAGDGGSTATLSGALTNTGILDIGNSTLSAATLLSAKGLTNSGTIDLAGSAALAKLVINGDVTTSGAIDIGKGSKLDAGAGVFAQNGGSTTVEGKLVAGTIDADAGLVDFKSAVTSASGIGALNIGSAGTLEFDASVDSSLGVDFASTEGALAIGDAGQFGATISGFAASDAINLIGQTITGLAYSGSATSGVLTVSGSGGTLAQLSFAGDYTTSSFSFSGSKILHA